MANFLPRLAPFIAALALSVGAAAAATTPVVHKVGAVTWHAKKFVGQQLFLKGYVLSVENGYVLFSDEPTGKVSAHDLPVTGPGIDAMQLSGKYQIEGVFLDHGLAAANGSPYHFELSAPPAALDH